MKRNERFSGEKSEHRFHANSTEVKAVVRRRAAPNRQRAFHLAIDWGRGSHMTSEGRVNKMKCSLTINSTWLENNRLGFRLKSAVAFFREKPFISDRSRCYQSPQQFQQVGRRKPPRSRNLVKTRS